MKTITTRRSIRKYSSREVSDELLTRLLTEAARTQTMGNMQLYSVVTTRSKEGKEALAPAHFNQPMVTGAPVVLTVCADFNRATTWCEQRKAQPGYDNLLSFINAMTDALLYTQTFCNLAEEEGLGLCFLGTTVYMPKMIIETLHLPRLVMPVATITLGWPDENPPLSDRIPTASFVHQEHYHDYTARHRPRIRREGASCRELGLRETEQQGDPCTDIHRHTLHQERQRGHVGWHDGGSEDAGVLGLARIKT